MEFAWLSRLLWTLASPVTSPFGTESVPGIPCLSQLMCTSIMLCALVLCFVPLAISRMRTAHHATLTLSQFPSIPDAYPTPAPFLTFVSFCFILWLGLTTAAFASVDLLLLFDGASWTCQQGTQLKTQLPLPESKSTNSSLVREGRGGPHGPVPHLCWGNTLFIIPRHHLLITKLKTESNGQNRRWGIWESERILE